MSNRDEKTRQSKGQESKIHAELTRREFVAISAGAAVAATLPPVIGCGFEERKAKAPLTDLGDAPTRLSQNFQDVYRKKWSWDGTVRNTHNVNCWFQQNCSWNVYTKDGVVVREEQAGVYPQSRPDVPDFNPRGCQKGCSYSELMYSEPRVTHPLRRSGPRGSGSWEEVSWDEALRDIAERMVDTIENDGPNRVVHDAGSPNSESRTRV